MSVIDLVGADFILDILCILLLMAAIFGISFMGFYLKQVRIRHKIEYERIKEEQEFKKE